jgi:hypothetical protein
LKLLKDANHEDGSSGLLSELSIVIQKQLSNSSEKYKQIGVIGTLALVKTLGAKELSSNDDNSNSSNYAIILYTLQKLLIFIYLFVCLFV